MKSKKKRSVALIISAVLGILYSIYMISYFSGAAFGTDSGAEALGGAIATALVTPHMVCVVIAAIFTIIAAIASKRGFALAGAVLYCAGALLFLMYAPFVVPSIVLSFIGYARLGKIANKKAPQDM